MDYLYMMGLDEDEIFLAPSLKVFPSCRKLPSYLSMGALVPRHDDHSQPLEKGLPPCLAIGDHSTEFKLLIAEE